MNAPAATPWHLGPLTPFDLESTGIDTREARIVTGYVSTVLGRAEGRRRSIGAQVLINPGVPIPPGATEVNGITDEIAQAKGCMPADGVNSIAEAVARSLLARIPVAGFNLPYDLALLHWECIRNDLPTVAERLGRPRDAMVGPIIDAHVLDKEVDRYVSGVGQRKLTATAARYGVPLTKAHTADADALAAVRVAVAIVERHPRIGRLGLAELHAAQKGWRAGQAAGLQAHFRKTKPESYVDPCFPYCVDLAHPTAPTT